MWIAIGIVGGLALLVALILWLPVYVVIKEDDGKPTVRVKILWMTFGEPSDSADSSVAQFFMDITGLSRTKGAAMKSNAKTSGVSVTVADTCSVLWTLVEQAVRLLPRCKLTRLSLSVVCAADSADQAALHYGKCCAVIYPTLGMIHSLLPIDQTHENIDIRCDFTAFEDEMHYDVALRTCVHRLLAVFCRVVYKEALRANRNFLSAQTRANRKKRRRSSPRRK